MTKKNVASLTAVKKKWGMMRYEEHPKNHRRIMVKLPKHKRGNVWAINYEHEIVKTDEKTGERTFRLTFEWVEMDKRRTQYLGRPSI